MTSTVKQGTASQNTAKKLVSIILPVYNVSLYLEECVRSLLAQTYENLEIFLVDDGSTDGCGKICDALAAKDSRVKAIHQPNGGAANARNHGLNLATGDYICLVDSDDVVAPDYVSSLVEHLEKENADIAVCGFYNWQKTGKEQVQEVTSAGVYSSEEYLLQFLKFWSCALLWNKIYRRKTVGDLRMEEGHRIDDEYFTYQVVMNAEKIVVFDTPLYAYRIRKSSVMNDMAEMEERVMLDRIHYMIKRYDDICQNFPSLDEPFLKNALSTFVRYKQHCKGMKTAKKILRKWTWSKLGKILKTSFSFKEKCSLLYSLLLKPAQKRGEPTPLLPSNESVFE